MFITLDILLEVGQIEESVTVTGQSPLIETSNASVGEALGREAPRKPAGPRPRGIPHRRHGPDGQSRRRPAVQPAAGSDQRLADLARRRRRPGEQLHGRWRADHRADRPRRPQPLDRSDRRGQGAGAHLRRRHGTHRRRRVQHDRQVGNEPVPRHRLLPDTSGLGPVARTISTPWPA